MSPRPRPVRRKRRIELNLYVEDIEWMEEMIHQRLLPPSRSEIVSQALLRMRGAHIPDPPTPP